MHERNLIAAAVVTAAMSFMPCGATHAFDDAMYPPLDGQWIRADVPGTVGPPPFDPAKPPGRGQQAPLTAEYQAKFEASLARARRQRIG